jgi:hypothetical protein
VTTTLFSSFKKSPQRGGIRLVGAQLNRIDAGGAKQPR